MRQTNISPIMGRVPKGITLIALVITIIVLLILAGVSLSLITGGNGILNRASSAVDENKIAKAKEQVELRVAEFQNDFYQGKYVDRSENGTKKGYISKELEEGKNTNEFYVQASEDGIVRVYDKDNVAGKPVVTGVILEDGSILWDAEVTKDTSVKATATAQYVGTSGCTVKVEANSTEGNIVKYQYKVNGEIVEETTDSSYTFEDLEPTTDYTITVTVTDDKGNQKICSTQITTKERTYLIKDGVEQVQKEIYNANAILENNYLKITTSSTTARSAWMIVYDLSNYKKLKSDIEVAYKGVAWTNCSVGVSIMPNGSNVLVDETIMMVAMANGNETSKPRMIYSLNTETLQGKYIFCITKNATDPATSAIMYVYNIWLEE